MNKLLLVGTLTSVIILNGFFIRGVGIHSDSWAFKIIGSTFIVGGLLMLCLFVLRAFVLA